MASVSDRATTLRGYLQGTSTDWERIQRDPDGFFSKLLLPSRSDISAASLISLLKGLAPKEICGHQVRHIFLSMNGPI